MRADLGTEFQTRRTTRGTPNPARIIAAVAAVCAACLPAGAALAAGGGGHGDPWLDLLYRFINFAILVGLLVYFLRKPVGRFLRGTADRTKQSLDDVRREAAEAEKRLADQKLNIQSLQNELISMRDEARAEADGDKKRLAEEARALADRFREQARLQVEQARNQAMADLRRELAGHAVREAEQLIRGRMDEGRQQRLVRDHMDQLEARS